MRKLNCSVGNSCHSKLWSNKEMSFEKICDRLKTPIRTTETAEEYPTLPKSERDKLKDKGGFVAGKLRNNRRKAENVVSRSMLVYDLDCVTQEFLDNINEKIPNKACYYTTHSHTPANPRARMIVPLTRDVTPDEFIAVARYYAADNGFIEMLDPCSFYPAQLMYWPTCPSNGEFLYGETTGDPLDPDTVLTAHPDWQDFSLLPVTPKESRVIQHSNTHQKDPLEKEGIIGAVCRTYSIQEVIEKYLSDVYEPTADCPGRYDYIKGEGHAGVVIYDDKFAYSHHATDPAYGKLCNAFDLVRLHLFSDSDEKESFSQTTQLFLSDEKVTSRLLKEKQDKAAEDFSAGSIGNNGNSDSSDESASDTGNSWTQKLKYNKKGIENNLYNIRLIMENDPNLKCIVFNRLADSMEIKGKVPWKHHSQFWRDADDSQLICYVDANYGTFSRQNYDIAVTKVADDRSYHPVHEMFDSLPAWDGVSRVETLLCDYLGAEDNDYVRAVTRKALCAAYKRVYQPGIKFDNLIVLNGSQGIGKSTLIAKLGGEWYSDSLNISDMNDKTAAEKLQGYWILEIGELAGMKKADIDKVKAFISRQDDKYRASFGRRVTPHPRQCIFFGTTNSENGYLRDITGNRRFWNVKVSGNGIHKPWELDEDTVRQIWAETKEIAADEPLYLDNNLEEFARREQCEAMEYDEREGLVREYLDMLLPANWDDMDIYERRDYFSDRNDPTRVSGTQKRESVSNIEIWCECFGKSKSELKPSDSYAISAIMCKIEGWSKSEKAKRIPIYGLQRLYQLMNK